MEWKAENKLFEKKFSSLKEERGAIFLGTCESGVVFEVRWADIWLKLELYTENGLPHERLCFQDGPELTEIFISQRVFNFLATSNERILTEVTQPLNTFHCFVQ
jgi:hypothetical protein